MISLSHLHFIFIQSHIAAGFVALTAFWVPLFVRKGGNVHRRFGKLYYYCGCYVAITAVISSAWALAAPDSYYGSNEGRNSESDQLQFLWAILFFLGLSIFTDLRLGVRLIQTKDTPDRLGSPFQKSLRVITGLAALWLIAYGVWQFRATEGQRYIICIVVGCIGAISTPSKLKFLANPSPTPRQWLYKHIYAMIGCGIGLHIAFLLFGFRSLVVMRWMDGPMSLAVSLSPFPAGFLAIALWTRHYKRRYGDT